MNKLAGLKFIELKKAENYFGKFENEDKSIELIKVEFFAVYLDEFEFKQQLEFFPIFEFDLIDGYFSGYSCSNFKGLERCTD